MSEPVKIGLVGLGQFGQVHARTIAGVHEAQLVAAVEPNAESATRVATQFQDIRVFAELAEAIANSDAQAWIIASSTASHVPIAKALLEAGKTVLIEKPIALSVEDAESLEPLVQPNSANLMLGHVALFNTEFRQLQKEAATRTAIAHTNAVRHRPIETLSLYPGESPLHLTMVHDLYCVQALRNSAEPTQFSAQVQRTPEGNPKLAFAQLQWDDGFIATFAAGFILPAGFHGDGFDQLDVYAADWSARLCTNPRPMQLWDDAARHPLALEIFESQGVAVGMLAEQLRHFCKVATNEALPPVGATYRDALQVMRWIDKLESASKD